jgi:TRAP-type C4-dicarboxylate transport system permease large subunit
MHNDGLAVSLKHPVQDQGRLPRHAGRALGAAVSVAAALLVVAEIVVLFSGVLARYAFHAPLIWSDELAGILFLWLAMLGAVLAFERGEHMRMTAVVEILTPRARAFLDVLAIAAPLVYRQFDWKRLYPMLVETASLTGAILLIIGTATGMAWALTQSGFSASVFMTSLSGGVPVVLAATIAAFVILGSVLEGIPAIVVFGPLLFPIAKQVGVHEVPYAMVVVLAMGIGLFAPPFGVGYYAACAISRIHPDAGMKPIAGYMLALLVGIIIVAAVPWISIGWL